MSATAFTDKMLRQGYISLDKAAQALMPCAMFIWAHQAACEAAAAVISARISQGEAAVMERPRSLWAALEIAAPELAEWPGYFARLSSRREAAERNIPNAVYRDQAEDLLADASLFLREVADLTAGRVTS